MYLPSILALAFLMGLQSLSLCIPGHGNRLQNLEPHKGAIEGGQYVAAQAAGGGAAYAVTGHANSVKRDAHART